MLLLSVLAQLAVAAVAVAQTPDGFVPSAQTPLSVVYPRNITVSPPGVRLQRADTQVQPTITAPPGTPADGTYIVFMIDLDVVRNGSTTTILHLYQADITLTPDLVLNAPTGNASTGASYIGPAPPPGPPHRYTFLLFSQPAGFEVPDAFSNISPAGGITDRLGFQITDFVAAAALDAPLAGTFFTVLNATGTASGTGAPAQTSPIRFEGVGSTLSSSWWMEVGLAALMTAVAASLWAA